MRQFPERHIRPQVLVRLDRPIGQDQISRARLDGFDIIAIDGMHQHHIGLGSRYHTVAEAAGIACEGGIGGGDGGAPRQRPAPSLSRTRRRSTTRIGWCSSSTSMQS